MSDIVERQEDERTIKLLRAEIERLLADLKHLRKATISDRQEITGLRAEIERLQRGWKEAVIGWSVCASIHREYAKDKDPFFKTRQKDFQKHEADARSYYGGLDE
jgi:uncharacterized small protein (DUF1192 family)